MNIEEFKKNRKNRMEKLYEALTNMPDAVDDKVQGVVDATTLNAIETSKLKDEQRKESFKEKNKEVREFIQDMDKATDAAEEDKAENRLMLDESLFNENITEKDLIFVHDDSADFLHDLVGLINKYEDLGEEKLIECLNLILDDLNDFGLPLN